jgi:hypothetical protein
LRAGAGIGHQPGDEIGAERQRQRRRRDQDGAAEIGQQQLQVRPVLAEEANEKARAGSSGGPCDGARRDAGCGAFLFG